MNTYGTLFKISIYGESHSKYMGVVIDGVIPGTYIDQKKIQKDLHLRSPKKEYETKRVEDDLFIIKSGVLNNYATGAPICIEIENNNIDSSKYEIIKDHPRPSHADLVAIKKYDGFNDYRGGGHFSGRLTSLIVIAGSIARSMIPFTISSEVVQIYNEKNKDNFESLLLNIKAEKDSVGGIIRLTVSNMIIGLGNPFFGKLNAEISKMLFSIPAVKGVDFGIGFSGVSLKGSEFNDMIINEKHQTITNNSGGINGGISNGNDITVNVFVKPISSIGKPQETYNIKQNKIDTLEIEGYHDSSIINRIGIVLESALAIVLLDQYLIYKAYGKK